jgi:hypothetical protein
MSAAGIARVRTCFENPIDVYPAGDPRNRDENSPAAQSWDLPQMPQQQESARKDLIDREDAFEERSAIMEHCGGIPRSLAEFLTGHWRVPRGGAGQ